MDTNSFYERVKSLCKERKTTIEAVVNAAGLTINSYNSYRRHNNLPRLDEGVIIAQALGVSVEYLVTGKEVDGKKQFIEDLKNFIDAHS